MKKIIIQLLIFPTVVVFASCNGEVSKDQYIKLAEYGSSYPYVAFIDVKTNEIVFVDLDGQRIEKRIPIK